MKTKSVALAAFVVMVGLAAIDNPATAQGQPELNFVTPGPNRNVIGLTPNPNTLRIPDYFRKQQNEPSCVQATDNPAEIFCGFNDCRASDWPEVQGDCWIGTAQSSDFGETWTSRLAPGYLGHPYSLGMGFAADPALAEIPGTSPGLILLAYIASHRDSDEGVIAVQRYVKSPREDGEPFLPEDRPAVMAATGSEGRFHDKVAAIFIVNDDNPQSSTSEAIDVEGLENPITINRLDGVYVIAYSVFTGNGSSVKILTQFSTDGGHTFSHPKKVSSELNTVTGVHLAYLPGVGLSLTYRRSRDSNDADGIVQAFSNNLARTWTKTETVFEICPHDQQASGNAARMFTFPWGADDGERFWVFSADKVDPATGERVFAQGNCTQVPGAPAGVYPGVSRIVGMSSTDGKNWYGSAENPNEPFVLDFNGGVGFQVFPFARGVRHRVDIAWWDTREEEAIRPPPDGAELPYIYDYLTSGGARVFRKASIFMTRIRGCTATTTQGACTPRQPIDDGLLSPVRVSRYQTAGIDGVLQEVEANPLNLRTHGSGKLAYNGDYGAFGTPRFRRLPSGKAIQNSLPKQAGEDNFVADENTFLAWGENRDVFFGNAVPNPADPNAQFLYSPPVNAAPGLQAPGYQASSEDAPDSAEMPFVSNTGDETKLKAVSEPDDEVGLGPSADTVVCSAAQNFSRSRDSNVYGSLVEDVPSMVALTQARQMNLTQRMFPLVISNPSKQQPGANYCLSIENQPPDYGGGFGSGRASFDPLPARNDPSLFVAPRERLDVLVSPLGTASRAVFVTSSDASTRIIVNAYDGNCPTPQDPGFGSLVSSVQLSDGQLFDPLFCEQNPMDTACALPVVSNETHNISLVAPGLQAPGYQAPGFQAPVYQAPVYQAPGFQAPVLQAPVLQAPGMQAPGFQAAGQEAPVLQAPSFQAPGFQAGILESNTLASPGMQAPSFQAPSLQAALEDPNADGSYEVYYQDLTYLVAIDANVTTTYSADIAVMGLDPEETSVELIAWQPNVHTTTSIVDGTCLALPEADNKIIAAVDLGSPGLQASSLNDVSVPFAFDPANQSPYAGEISFAGKPGDRIPVTVRLWVTGTAKETLDHLHECSTSATPPADCMPQEIKNGAFLLVPFGAGAHGCSTTDVENTDPDVDCISAGAEKIVPPDLFPPVFFPEDGGSVAHEAESPAGALVNTPGTVPDGINVTDADPDVTVFCNSQDVTLNDGTTQFPFGDTVVSCTAIDSSLNQSIADITISIIDTVPPEITVPADIGGVEATGPNGAAITFLVTATDITTTTIGCEIPDGSGGTLPVSSGDTLPLGVNTVSCTATDQGGNTATDSFVVMVIDTTPPALSGVPGDISGVEATSGAGAAVSWSAPAATDIVDGALAVGCSPPSGSTFALGGPHVVTCSATDSSGNSSIASFNVTVVDTTPPVVSINADILVQATGSTGAMVSWVNPGAVDAVDGILPTVCAPPSGTVFAVGGPYPVMCSATDGAGNVGSTGFNVTVVDTIAPAVDAMSDLVFEATGPDGAVATWTNPGATDLVDGLIATSCSPTSGTTFALGGPHVVTCSATDANGNTGSTTFGVTVQDTTPPAVTAADINVPLLAGSVEVDYVAGVSAVDIVDGNIAPSCYIVNPDDPDDMSDNANPRLFTDTGTWTANCAATDAAGNTGSWTFSINVAFPYGIKITAIKLTGKAGSTNPVDWQYTDPTSGDPVDSEFIMPSVSWFGPYASNDTTCAGASSGEGNGDDAGSSDKRYSASSRTWQFSWKTPDIKGRFLLVISPPGEAVAGATKCVRLN